MKHPPMSRLWLLVQAYIDREGGISAASVARKAGVPVQLLNKWKVRGSRPKPHNLRALAKAIEVNYEVLLAAVDADAGYYTDDELMTVLRGKNISDEVQERLRRHVAKPIEPHAIEHRAADREVNGE